MQARAQNGAMVRTLKSDSKHDRTHWQHGPIDIVLDLHGEADQIDAAKQALWLRFPHCLPALVSELVPLRTNYHQLPVDTLRGSIAVRMGQAVQPFAAQFITPMAAVAGSVAQEFLNIAKTFILTKIIVNNGGDIAVFGTAHSKISIALLAPSGLIEFYFHEPREYGIATSGWSGRSFSLGIADAVTVVAQVASRADAAATMIANAVGPKLEHSAIRRVPANNLKDDTDLGSQLVTTRVDALPKALVLESLRQGERYARELLQRDLILSASLFLQGESVIVSHSTIKQFQPQFKLAA
jgi:uncharacterized protein